MTDHLRKGVFENEVLMCRKLSKENDGKCNWGECSTCGVILLLYKLGKGELYEDSKDIENLREKVLS